MCNLKAELRIHFLQLRKNLGKAQIEKLSQKITHNFLNSDFIKHSSFGIFLTLENKYEVETRYLTENLLKLGKIIGIPVIKNSSMDFYRFDENTSLRVGYGGIYEPIAAANFQPEVVITPLLISDKRGYRVGYGKGFYDRYFREKNPDCIKVGINFFSSIERIDDTNASDIPLDYLITPENIESFSANSMK